MKTIGLIVLAALFLTANPHADGAAVTKAVAVLHATRGNNVSGTVTFTKVQNGMRVVADIEGLTPGDHGFHIHDFGDCSAPDGTSAGGHFNPDGHLHAGPGAKQRHEGDLGNVTANANGKAHYDLVDTQLSFDGQHSIIGRSVIVHEKADDFKTQPTGNAGARVACGVIGVANP
jgi:superoxide dismutase, Cu-Zn family